LKCPRCGCSFLNESCDFSGFDAPQVYYSDNFGDTGDAQGSANAAANNLAVKKRFKEFLRQFSGAGNFSYKYRDALKRNYTLRQYWISVNLEDLARYSSLHTGHILNTRVPNFV
jgi:hypothetical protein